MSLASQVGLRKADIGVVSEILHENPEQMVVTVVFLNGDNRTIRINKVGGIGLSTHRVYQLVIAWMRIDDDVQRGSDDPVAEVVGYHDLGDRNDFLVMLANSADIDSDTECNHTAKEVKAANTFSSVPHCLS